MANKCSCGRRAYLDHDRCMACISETIMHGEATALKEEISSDSRRIAAVIDMNIWERERLFSIANTFPEYTKGVNL